MNISAINSFNTSVRHCEARSNEAIFGQNKKLLHPKGLATTQFTNSVDLQANYNKAFISFKGYGGDIQPAKKLFWIVAGHDAVYEDNFTKDNLYNGGNTGWKKWIDVPPTELLKRTPEQAIQSICTLSKQPDCYPGIPSYIPTPNYGDKWGRRANFIEINPRTIAVTQGSEKLEGILNMVKLLPAIPPSPKSFANCVILSQLYPSINGDGYTGNSSLYTVNLHSGFSKNLVSKGLWRDGQRMGEDELVKSFNDLAHLRGLKTGMRLPLSAGQLKVQGRDFDWNKDEKAFIDACCHAVELGFDAIYFDSAKHVGNHDMGNYCGSGSVPNFGQMQYITQQIKDKTGRSDIALIGEKADNNYRFKEMGLTAGSDWSKADDFSSVLYEYDQQRYNDEYASGPVISDDNDEGQDYGQRLNRVKNAFNGYREIGFRLPSHMQMQDIFPTNEYTNTHKQMLYGENHSAYGDLDSHYNNLFDKSPAANDLRRGVYNEFLHVMYL